MALFRVSMLYALPARQSLSGHPGCQSAVVVLPCLCSRDPLHSSLTPQPTRWTLRHLTSPQAGGECPRRYLERETHCVHVASVTAHCWNCSVSSWVVVVIPADLPCDPPSPQACDSGSGRACPGLVPPTGSGLCWCLGRVPCGCAQDVPVAAGLRWELDHV